MTRLTSSSTSTLTVQVNPSSAYFTGFSASFATVCATAPTSRLESFCKPSFCSFCWPSLYNSCVNCQGMLLLSQQVRQREWAVHASQAQEQVPLVPAPPSRRHLSLKRRGRALSGTEASGTSEDTFTLLELKD